MKGWLRGLRQAEVNVGPNLYVLGIPQHLIQNSLATRFYLILELLVLVPLIVSRTPNGH